jgi:hypothetical protein
MILSVDFFSNGLCTFCHEVQNELIGFSHFHSETENSWTKKEKELQNEFKNVLNKVSKENHEELIQVYAEESHCNQIKYPCLHREALVVTLYNFFENKLNELCNILNETDSLNLKLKDLHGSGIERAFLYLTKVSGFDISDITPEIPYLKNVSLLRHQIVHNGGRLPNDISHKVNIFLENNKYISGCAGGMLMISQGFINEYINVMSLFFEKLDIKIVKYMRDKLA